MIAAYLREENLFFDQKGPLVLSATIHLVAIFGFFLWSLVAPDKKPEELVFVLSEPPAAAASEASDGPQLRYEPERVEIPTIEPLKPVPPREALPTLPPDPVVEAPKPKPKPVETKPEPAPTMTLEEFQKLHGKIDKPQNVRDPAKNPPKPVDLSKDIAQMTRSLKALGSLSLPPAKIESMSLSDQNALLSYFDRFKSRLARETERHPVGSALLRARVRFDISASGIVSGATLVGSSGDSLFDQKVLDAFRRIRSFEAPPSGQAYRGLTLEIVQE